MSSHKKNDKLDELISKTINTEDPQFDAEKWKQKYPDEYQTLISRREKTSSSDKPSIWIIIFNKPLIQLATAAAVILVVGLLLSRGRQNPNGPVAKPPLIAPSSTQIVSLASMRMTYQQGGLDALDQQLQDTLDVLGPRSSSISIQELLESSTMF